MFAIYYSTVISVSAAECREEFGEEKPRLLQRCVGATYYSCILLLFFCYRLTLMTAFRYQEGVERALVRANFLSSKDITVLQAFVIYLVSTLSVEQSGRSEVAYLISLTTDLWTAR